MSKQGIKLLIMDVDGTLTDGGVYIGENGEVMKQFYIKDGYAVKHMLPQYKIVPVILTGRTSEIVTRRCEELCISTVLQGVQDKVLVLDDLKKMFGVTEEQIAYIGDDINDLEIMKRVGVRGCPSDAVQAIKEISDFVSSHPGGRGAVREFIEWLISVC